MKAISLLRPLVLVSLGLQQSLVGAESVGSVPSEVARPSYRYDDFAPYGRRAAGSFKFGQWSTVPVDSVTTWVYWGDPRKWQDAEIEEHAVLVHPVDGRRWVWVRAYIDQKLQRRYAIATTRAELIRGDKVEDVTPPAGMGGQPYALADFDGPFTVRVWGTVAQDPRVCATSKAQPPDVKEDGCDPMKRRKWFWQHTITPLPSVQNPCWSGSGPSWRPALLQEEVWWDSNRGWARGSGQLDAAGNPTGEGLRYEGMQTIAKGIGFAWTGAHGNCLVSTPTLSSTPNIQPTR
jgi:hypothetical protein